jgi:hypothetical protein
VLQLHTATAVGRVCRVTHQAVSQWAIGITRPGERARAVLETRYKIPPESWYQAADRVAIVVVAPPRLAPCALCGDMRASA